VKRDEDESTRAGAIERAFRRWQTALAAKLLGWAFPVALACLAAVWLARRPRLLAVCTCAAVCVWTYIRWSWPPFAALALAVAALLSSARFRALARTRARRAGYAALAVVADPLRRPVPLPEPAAPDLDALGAVTVGRRENGDPLTLAVWRPGRGTTHLLVAGVTGSGKGSAVWSLIAGLGPSIRDGLVSVWAVDPKGGAELGGGLPLFDRFVCGGPTRDGSPWQTSIADLLDDAVTGMQARLVAMRDPTRPGGPIRVHTPTPTEPVILLVVDEVASITAYAPTPVRTRVENALSLLLSQGRAAGVFVVLATQDPRKQTLAFRDLIPERVALRTAEPVADLILGPGMRERGAVTEAIDRRLPGVGFLVDERSAEPVRVRFSYVSDAQLADLARRYAPRPPEVPVEVLRAPSTRVPT
jgi:S-DNA-T family DNA segregation ATPase FtsK/SpoIIIE